MTMTNDEMITSLESVVAELDERVEDISNVDNVDLIIITCQIEDVIYRIKQIDEA